MKVYYASSLFNNAEKEFNLRLTEKIEALGLDVFLPQRDGVESDQPPYSEMTPAERHQLIYNWDRDEVCDCDIFLFILDGRVPDEGACVELGIAHTHRWLLSRERHIIGLLTDVRGAFLDTQLNPMIAMSLDKIVRTEDELLEALRELA